MDTFFLFLKKSLVATMFVIFGFVATYIPQPFNHIDTAEAGPGVGGATEFTQIANNVQLAAVNVATTASAGFDAVTSFATNSLWIKENILDGIGWALAKRIVSMMVRDLINWINSGFSGSPMFVQDLKGFLLQAADEVIGEYISDLGGAFDFICSPFRLDVQVSVALQYQQARANGGDGNPAPTCTLSGIVSNIENFIAGSFTEGGWQDWFTITATPETYTPYGSMLSAQAGARARIINAQGEEIKLLEFGDGFLSGEICELVSGPGVPKEECFITKPGKIIEEALSFNLDSGRQSLIAADEINEIIAALLGQLANTVMTGAAGLLGLSGGTGYTYSGYGGGSYVNNIVASSTQGFNFVSSGVLISDTIAVQTGYANLAATYEPLLNASSTDSSLSAARRNAALVARNDARAVLTQTYGITTFPAPLPLPAPTPTSSLGRMQALQSEYNDPDTTQARKLEIIDEFMTIDAYSDQEVRTSQTNWDNILR